MGGLEGNKESKKDGQEAKWSSIWQRECLEAKKEGEREKEGPRRLRGGQESNRSTKTQCWEERPKEE
jgi:hypothetical protein